MAQAKKGDIVRVHYRGLLQDGTVFDSSLEREPFEFTLGQGMVISGFENAILGMNEGETKRVEIKAEDAYGSYRDDLLMIVEKSMLPPNIDPIVGMNLRISSPDGNYKVVTVIDVTDNTITLDANHPLAGKDLIFEIKLLEII
jgi:FKBP-type peptidyl-prolyl cis-trans isomerase 2